MKKKRILGSIIAAVAVMAISSQALAETNQTATSGSVDLTNVSVLNDSVTPFSVTPAVDTGGGTWDYGTSYVFPLSKKVWSNYNHPKYIHGSSCSIGTTESHSGDQNPGVTAYSSAVGGATEDTHAYWNAQYVPGI